MNAYTLTFAVLLLTGAALGGIALAPMALLRLRETYGIDKALDLPGLALVSAGLLGLVWGPVNGNADGWTSPRILAALGLGVVLLAAFVRWELRARTPMLQEPDVRSSEHGLAAHDLRHVRGDLPAHPVLPDGAGPLPAAGRPPRSALDPDADGRRTCRRRALRPDRWPAALASGLGLQALGLAWNAAVTEAGVGHASLVGPFVISGIGVGLFFAPLANVVLGSVARNEEGKASGAINAVREVGSVC